MALTRACLPVPVNYMSPVPSPSDVKFGHIDRALKGMSAAATVLSPQFDQTAAPLIRSFVLRDAPLAAWMRDEVFCIGLGKQTHTDTHQHTPTSPGLNTF
jgi:hypothetical protein